MAHTIGEKGFRALLNIKAYQSAEGVSSAQREQRNGIPPLPIPTRSALFPLLTAFSISILSLACAPDEDDSSHCGPSTALVTRVIDGDTIELHDGHKVRYLMVDTPEITKGKNECGGQEAFETNRQLVENQEVSLSYSKECTDRYGRLLAYVSVNGRELNSELVERGYACVLHIPPNGCSRLEEFLSLEEGARDDEKGIWGSLCETAPCKSMSRAPECSEG